MNLFGGNDTAKIRIDDGAAMSLLLTAGLLDLFSLVPVINIFTAFLGWIILAARFNQHKVSIFGTRTVWAIAFFFIVELIPFVSIFPSFLFFTKWLIYTADAQDKERIALEEGRIQ